MLNNRIIETMSGEVLVVGRINILQEYYIEVEILSPYVNWINHSSITGPGKQNPQNFLHKFKEVSESLLKESYEKLRMIDESIDRIVKVYNDLQEELESVSYLQNSWTKERIENKLSDWFFRDFLFTSSVTGKVASFFEEDKIKEIINVYKDEKRKIYIRKSDPDIENKNPKIKSSEIMDKVNNELVNLPTEKFQDKQDINIKNTNDMENELMTFEKVQFIDEDKISVVFLSLIVKVSSINKKYPGGMKEFIRNGCVYGITNGRLFIMCDMMSSPSPIDNVIDELFEPNGIEIKKDYVYGLDERYEFSNHGKPMHWCEVPWLKSEILPNGNFVSFKNK